jgi:two-component system chemotaxis sensor kinase CheA
LAIPVTDVYEIYGLSRSEIFESQGREMIDVRGTLLPLYRFDEMFAWNDFLPPQQRRCEGLVQAVLVRHGHRCLAIEVDDLDGNADIVVKTLDDHFSQIPGLGGACVMGDGEVCLVLDTASLHLRNPNPQPTPKKARLQSPTAGDH